MISFTNIQQVIIYISLTLLVSCDEKYSPREYPRVNTLPVTNITKDGASFNSEIIYGGDYEIISYGFIWSDNNSPDYDYSDKKVFTNNLAGQYFSANVNTTLAEGRTYFVYSYAKTDDYLVYGKTVSFVSLGSEAPNISSISPISGTVGDTLEIYGNNFSYRSLSNIVNFDQIGADIQDSSDSTITITVPQLSNNIYDISVSIVNNIAVYENKFNVTTPIIESISSDKVSIDDTLTITGTNFSYVYQANELTIGGIKCRIINSDKNSINAIIPANLQINNSIQLVVAGQVATKGLKLGFNEPEIVSFEPRLNGFGDTVTIFGSYLSPIVEHNSVNIDGTEAVIISASKSSIKFIVPDDLNSNSNNLILKVAGRSLTLDGLLIKPSKILSILPNYFNSSESSSFEIHGENFNLIGSKNEVFGNGEYLRVLNSTRKTLKIGFPGLLIPDKNISVLDTLDIVVSVFGRSDTLAKSIIIDYPSTWTKKNNFPGLSRIHHAQFLVNGKAYIGLGQSNNNVGYSDLWEYNALNDTWIKKEDFPGTVNSKVTVLNFGSKVYFVGGYKTANSYLSNQEVWEYDPNSDLWVQKNNFPGVARYDAFGFVNKGKGYVGGGRNTSGDLNEMWEYNPQNDTWSQKDNLTIHGTNSGIGFSVNDRCYIITTLDEKIIEYSPSNDSYSVISQIPSDLGRVTNQPFVIDDILYILSDDIHKLFSYDLSDDTWETIDFSENRRLFTAGFSLNGRGYILLGKPRFVNYLINDVWEFDPTKP